MNLSIMKIEYCRNCAMDINSHRQSFRKRRIIIRIVVDVTIWMTASLIAFYLFLFGKPYERGFFCDDKSLSYPSVSETISTPLMVAVGLTVSIVLVIFVEVLNCLDSKSRERFHRASVVLFCVKSYIVFMIGFLIQELFVDAIKNKIGILRPNFFDVCKPKFNATLCPGYISEYTCNGSDYKEIRSSRQSFPSGHSSFAMYIAIYFCLYIEHRLQITLTRLLKICIQVCLILSAVFCGLGRIKEHKHHPSDVIAGFILGLAVAVFVHTTLWKRYLTEEKDRKQNKNGNKILHNCCCLCEQPSELGPQTPSSLLQNEYLQTIENERNSPSAKLISLQNNNNQNVSEARETV